MALDTLHKLHHQPDAEPKVVPRKPVQKFNSTEPSVIEATKEFARTHPKFIMGAVAVSMFLGAYLGFQNNDTNPVLPNTPTTSQPNASSADNPVPAKPLSVVFNGLKSENGCESHEYTIKNATLRAQANGYTQEITVHDMAVATQTCADSSTHIIQRDGEVVAGTEFRAKKVAVDVTDMEYSASITNADISVRTVPPGEVFAEKGLDKVLCPQLGLWGCPDHDQQPEAAKLQPEVQQSLILSAEAAVLQAIQNKGAIADYKKAIAEIKADIVNQVIAQGGTEKMVTVVVTDAKGKQLKTVPSYMHGVLGILQKSGAAITNDDHKKMFGESLNQLATKVEGA